MREALLAMLVKEPAHGYELRQRVVTALGPLGEGLNPGQVYVTLSRLERAGLVKGLDVAQDSAPGKRVYEATAEGRKVATAWLTDVSWGRAGQTEFHLKLVIAARGGLADPVSLIDAQRRELLRQLAELQRQAEAADPDDAGWVLLEGAALRIQADIRWLEACERHWIERS
jgi:DNA-binding PadR family transcriptional regulator